MPNMFSNLKPNEIMLLAMIGIVILFPYCMKWTNMKEADFDLAAYEMSQEVDAYLKYLVNPDENSLVKMIMPSVRQKFTEASPADIKHLYSIAKKVCADAIRNKR